MTLVNSSMLSNGVVVLTEHIPHARGVGLSVLVGASPQDEPADRSGLAHLCEHALFLGTRTRSEQQISGLIDSAGGQLGGFTARDYTCFNATISGEYVTYAVDLLGDLISSPYHTRDRLDTEIEIVGHEIDSHEDEADTWLDSQLKRIMWPGDPLGRSIIGSRESLARVSGDDVQSFLNEFYRPDRIIVAAAGQINHDEFVEQTNDSFWPLSGQSPQRNELPARSVGGVIVEPREQRASLLTLMIPTPVYTDADRYALHILVTLLGGGMSSRLFRTLREKSGLAYSATASLNAYGRGGVIAIEVSTLPESVMPCLSMIFGQLAQLAFEEDSIGEEELWHAKMQVRGQAYLSSDSIQTRVSRLATQQLYFGHPIDAEAMLSEIESVDRSTLCTVSQRILRAGLSKTAIGIAGQVSGTEEGLLNDVNELRDCFDYKDDDVAQTSTKSASDDELTPRFEC